MKKYFIPMLVLSLCSQFLISQCGITISNPMPPLIISDVFTLQNVSQREVLMKQGNFMTQDIKFENCNIYLDSDYIYNNSTDPIPRMEFINCKIYVDRGFRGSTSTAANGFISMPVQFVFDGCCFEGDSPAEVLHIQGGGLIFTNNTVNITNSYHMFHFLNIDLLLENVFYGNIINFQIDEGALDGVISFEQNNGTIKIGDNSKKKNVFNVRGTAIVDRGSNDKIIIENTEFNIDDDYNLLVPEAHAIHLSKSKSLEVDNCVITGEEKSEIGIFLKSCENFKISNSQFNTFEEGILVSEKTKQFDVSSCTFSSNKTAIKSSFANQSLNDGEISNNTFTSNTVDIHSTGAWRVLNIKTNNFSGQEYGILADGDNQYNIEGNSFFNSYAGSILYSNGDNINSHTQNQFNSIIGVHSLNENMNYEFLDNCFFTTGGDVYIDGSVNEEIGDQGREAGNCFTKQNIPDISAIGSSFGYFRPDTKVNTCSDPITSGTYTKQHGASNQDLFCGSGIPYTGPIYNYCNFKLNAITCSQAKILANQLWQQILFVQNTNTYNNPNQKAYLLKRLKLCRSRLLKFMLGCVDKLPDDPKLGDGSFINPVDAIQAGNELMNSTNKYESAAYVGLAIELGMMTEASSYLATMPYSDEEMLDFKDVQLLNIQYQMLGDSFVLTQSQKAMLYSKGQKSHPLAAYARGLYYQLTGETIYPDIPVKTLPRSKSGDGVSVSIYPNPVDDIMTIVHNNDAYHVNIMNVSGHVTLSHAIEGGPSTFDTSTWTSGLYIVTLQEHDGRVSSYKVVKP